MSNTFRKKYTVLDQDDHILIIQIKEACGMVERLLLNIKSREMSLALTNLEQCSMWATKAIVLENEKRNQDQNKVC